MNTISLKQPSQDIQTILSISASLVKSNKFSKNLQEARAKPLEQLIKIKLAKNQTPINKWKSPSNQSYHIPSNNYNIDIPTGRNLIVAEQERT